MTLGDVLSWDVSFRRALRQSELVEFESLLSLLANVSLCMNEVDRRIWKPDSLGLFSSRSFYMELEPFSRVRPPCTTDWKGLVPL